MSDASARSTQGEPVIVEMTPADYDEVLALWHTDPGVGVSDADDRPGIERCLARNPGLSFVARAGGRVVGAVLGCDNGRRGMLTHLLVAAAYRGRGVGRRLAERSLAAMRAAGLRRCNIMVFGANESGRGFWRHLGFEDRPEVVWMTQPLVPGGTDGCEAHRRQG